MMKWIVFVCVALSAPLAQSQTRSFKEVRDQVLSNPTATLPTYGGVTLGNVARAFFTCSGLLVSRAKGTLSTPTDFKAAAPKLLHPMGVVAEATWKIDAASGASGLLAEGTEVRAIVRLSAANADTTYDPKKKRSLGIAIKLFPTDSETTPVETKNLFFLDEFGLDGSTRERYLDTQYFENSAPGGGFGGKLVATIFKRFDKDPTIRPIYPLTEVTGLGQAVSNPVTPTFLRLVPRILPGAQVHVASDFRDELNLYEPGQISFDIVIPAQSDVFPEEIRIGTLTLGKTVVTTVGDQELHFHHHPMR